MFVVISQRLDFVRNWTTVLQKRGAVVALSRTDDWSPCLNGQAATLMVVDYLLLGDDPAARLKQWRALGDKAFVILSGALFAPPRELAALAAGVVACCDPALAPTEIDRILDVVLQGGVWISPATLPQFISRLQAFSARQEVGALQTNDAVIDKGLASLTERQREVAILVGQGANNKNIARQLDITDRTVKAHLGTIFEKLGVKDRLQLALLVTKNGRQ